MKASFNYSKNVFFIIFSLSFEVLFSVDRAKITSPRDQTSMENPGQRRPFLDHHSVGTWAENVCSFATPSTLPVFKLCGKRFLSYVLSSPIRDIFSTCYLLQFFLSWPSSPGLSNKGRENSRKSTDRLFCHHLLKKQTLKKMNYSVVTLKVCWWCSQLTI